MKNLFTSLIFMLFFAGTALSQLVVTELSYNPPETNTDSLEYIELYNLGSAALNLKDYKFTKGIEFTFPEVTINAGGYLLLSVNEGAFMRNYNKPSLQWTSGALNNGGEALVIADASGTEIYAVDFKDVAPWPTVADGTDGEGKSIEICNPEADPNEGDNWKVSLNNLGFMINGKQVFGTPGLANSIPSCSVEPDFIVEVASNFFTPKDITIDVGQTVRWVNTGGTHNINGSQATFPANPESFGNGAPSGDAWTYDFTFNTAGFYNYQCDPHASLGMMGTVTVNGPVIVDIYPVRTITSVSTTNADGQTDSLNVTCTLQGIVYGVNINAATGLQFTVMDANNNGIGAFSGSGNLGYTVQEGDEVEIKGRIDNFRGLTQMRLDSVRLISEGNNLVSPKVVTEFVEEDESSLLTVENLDYVDISQWTGMGSGFNLIMTNGTNEFTIRIDNDVDLYSNGPVVLSPGSKLSVTGLLGQFAPQTAAPYSGGYQLLPRYIVDFLIVTNVNDSDLDPNMTLSPNPVNNIITIKTDAQPESIIIYNAQGQQLSVIQNTLEVDMSAFVAGVYFIKAVKADKSSTVRIIKM
jgi:plastocyanin